MTARNEKLVQSILAGDRFFVRDSGRTRRLERAAHHLNAGTEYLWQLRAAAFAALVCYGTAVWLGYMTQSWATFVLSAIVMTVPVATVGSGSMDELVDIAEHNRDLISFPASPIADIDQMLEELAEHASYGSEAALVVVANRDEVRLTAARNRAARMRSDHVTNLAADEAYTQLRGTLRRSLDKAKAQTAEAREIERAHARQIAAIEAEHRAAQGELNSLRLADEVRDLTAALES